MLVALVLLACSNVPGPEFGGGGSRYTTGNAGTGTGGGGEDDTGTGETGGDTGEAGVEGAPVLGAMILTMSVDDAKSVVVDGVVELSDDEGDVEGGSLYVDWMATDGAGVDGFATLTIGGEADPTADEYAWVSSSTLSFHVTGFDASTTYTMILQARDAAGHLSLAVEDSVGPLE